MRRSQHEIDRLRWEAFIARGELSTAVEESCDGPHELKQHRDRKPAWCHVCGRDAIGRIQRTTTNQENR